MKFGESAPRPQGKAEQNPAVSKIEATIAAAEEIILENKKKIEAANIFLDKMRDQLAAEKDQEVRRGIVARMQLEGKNIDRLTQEIEAASAKLAGEPEPPSGKNTLH